MQHFSSLDLVRQCGLEYKSIYTKEIVCDKSLYK